MRTWLILRYDNFKQPDPIWLMCFCAFVKCKQYSALVAVEYGDVDSTCCNNRAGEMGQPTTKLYIYIQESSLARDSGGNWTHMTHDFSGEAFLLVLATILYIYIHTIA